MEDLNGVQWLATTALLHHGTRQGMLPQGIDESEGEQQARLTPGPEIGHEGGEPMLRGVQEPMSHRRTPGLYKQRRRQRR
jgi:hypothetical protein